MSALPATSPPMGAQGKPWPAELAHHAADEILLWCRWHMARAKARGLTTENETELDAVIDAAAEVASAIEEGDPPGAIDAARERLHAAISKAKTGTDARCGGWRARAPIDQSAMAQCIEVETSFLRGWARAIDSIAECARDASEAPDQAHARHIAAVRYLAFFAPPRFVAVQEMTE